MHANLVVAVIMAILVQLASAAPWDACFETNQSSNYSVVDPTYTSINNGFNYTSSPTFSSTVSIGNIYGNTSAGSLDAGIGPLYQTPPFAVQFDFLNQVGGNFNINYSVADLSGVLAINQTSIVPSSGSCWVVSSQVIGQTFNVYYQCAAVPIDGYVTIEATNNFGMASSTTRWIVSSTEAFHCFFDLTPVYLGTSTLSVSYIASSPISATQVAVSLNGNHVGYLTGSGFDVFIGIPNSWISNTSIADYVFTYPSQGGNTVNITSATLSYYGGRTFYTNYTMDFEYGQITVQDTGVYFADYEHATIFERFMVGIAGYFPLIIAVALLLLVWRVGAYWERTGT